MAGVHATLEVTSNTIGPALRSLRDAGDDLQAVLGTMGEYLVRATRERAARQVDPAGNAWQALSPRYQRWKRGRRPGAHMLRLDSHMLGDQLSHQVRAQELLVGTNAPYGAAHQFGDEREVAARKQTLYFRQDQRTGALSPRFVKKSRSNFAQDVDVGAHTRTLPARPWLGVSKEDELELLTILADHIARRLEAGDGVNAAGAAG